MNNRIYKLALATNTMSLVASVVKRDVTNTAWLQGITKLGANWYGVYRQNGAGSPMHIVRFDGSWGVAATINVSDANAEKCTIGNDGTDLWIASAPVPTSGSPVSTMTFRRYLVNLSTTTVQETVASTLTAQVYSSALPYGIPITGLGVGNFDFGVRKFVVSYQQSGGIWQSTVVETAGGVNSAVQFTSDGVTNPFGIVWKGTSNNDTAGRFVQCSGAFNGGIAPDYSYKYDTSTFGTNKLTGRTQDVYFGYTYNRISPAGETLIGPIVKSTMYNRWKWQVTIGNPPAGFGARIYTGATAISTDLDFTAAIAAGSQTVKSEVNFNGLADAPPPTTSNISGASAVIQSLSTFTQTIDGATRTSGSPIVLTSAARVYMVGRAITGTGIPANTFVGSVVEGSSLNLADAAGNPVNATSSASGTASFFLTLPKLEVRGDGYARITELERVIISSPTDANISAGNMPALRVGNVNGTHLRIDGNEILAMTGDATQGTLFLNLLGKVGFGNRTWRSGTVSVPQNSSVNVDFTNGGVDLPFLGTPVVMLSNNSNMGSTVTCNIFATSVTTSGFTCNVNRSTAVNTSVRWLAIDM